MSETGRLLRTFTIEERLENAYSDQLVHYALAFELEAGAGPHLRLLDGDTGAPVPFQLAECRWDGKGDGRRLRSATLWFRVDQLVALGMRRFLLHASPTPAEAPPSAVQWSDLGAETVEVSNGTFALRLAGCADYSDGRDASACEGPLRGFRGADGVWRGAGRLQVESPVRGHTLEVAEHGPLFTTFASRFRFASPPGTGGERVGPEYEFRVTLYPERDYCRVAEKSDFPLRLEPMPRCTRIIPNDAEDPDTWRLQPCPSDNFVFDCEAGWHADHLYTHTSFSRAYADYPLQPDQLRVHTALRPALPYIDGGWFATYASTGQDLLALIAVDARRWQYPDNTVNVGNFTPGCHAEVMFVHEPGSGAYFRCPLARMERHWLLVVTTREKVVRDAEWVKAQTRPSLMREYPARIEPDTCYLWQLRRDLGDLPLDKIKDWVLDYDEPQDEHPGLFPAARDRKALLAKIESTPSLARHFHAALKEGIYAENFLKSPYTEPYARYLATGEYDRTGDEADPAECIASLKEHLLQGYNAYMYVLTLGGRQMPYLLHFMDVVAPAIQSEDWNRMCRFALAGAYILADDDYWQYAYVRGSITYLPNFNMCRWYSLGLCGLFFRNHPDAPKWIAFARYYLEKDLDYYVSVDGVGAENVCNYFPFAWRMYSLLVRLFHERGIADYRTHPKYLAAVRFWLEVMAPPDPRFDPPRRTLPPIGNHPYYGTSFGMHQWNRDTLKDVAPELAAEQQWAWKEFGQHVDFQYPMPLGYMWTDEDAPAKVPDLHSRALDGFGYVFRNHFPSDRETFLTFKAGWAFYHYDEDEGSFHMVAKGVPLACDGLELIGYAHIASHNILEVGPSHGDAWIVPCGGDLTAHLESPTVDWARGFFAKENTRGSEFQLKEPHTTDWQRDIVLVKSPDPEGAEYFVVFDHVNGPDVSTWHLDVHSEEPVVEPGDRERPTVVRYPGIRRPGFGVGLDVFFVTPAAPEIQIARGVIANDYDQLTMFPVIEHWHIHSPRKPMQDTLAVLFPRRQGQALPTVTPIIDGRGCVIEHESGRDTILAAGAAFDYRGSGVEFAGRLAVVRERACDRSVALLDGERIACGTIVLEEQGEATW